MQSQTNIDNDVRIKEELWPLKKDDENEAIPISKVREALPQIFAVAIKNILVFTFGSSLGFATILIPALTKDNPEIVLTLDELTWISSINGFLIPIGTFLSGLISEYIGRKRMMMFSTCPFIIAWLMLHYGMSYMVLLIALAITGLVGGLFEAATVTYVAEITKPNLRGMLFSTSSIAVTCGIFAQMFGATLATWRTMALVNACFPAVALAVLWLIPESPYWLASKGQFQSAEKSLCWLRGWVSPFHVKQEYLLLQESIKIRNSHLSNLKGKFWLPYFQRRVYMPFFIIMAAFISLSFGGAGVIQTFAVLIFDHLKTPIDKYTTTAILGAAQLLGTILCISLIQFVGKRKLYIVSVCCTTLLFLLIGIYGFLVDYNVISSQYTSWLPMVMLIAEAFIAHIGVRILPWILIGELFPSDVRSVAAGICASLGVIFLSVVRKFFLYLVIQITIPGVMLFFAAVTISTFIVIYFILPETEGKTLLEIEQYFDRNISLNRKPIKTSLTSYSKNSNEIT